MDHKIKETEDGLVICQDTCCPLHGLTLSIKIPGVAQHDGHCWSNEDVKECEDVLIREILDDINIRLKAWVGRVRPFAGHQCYESSNLSNS